MPTLNGKRPKRARRTNLTVSVGVAERTARLSTPQRVLDAADEALYRAKRGGRNRVCC